jgi:hypothetical protein
VEDDSELENVVGDGVGFPRRRQTAAGIPRRLGGLRIARFTAR